MKCYSRILLPDFSTHTYITFANLGGSIAGSTQMSQCRRTTPDITNFLLDTTRTRAILGFYAGLQNQFECQKEYLCLEEIVERD